MTVSYYTNNNGGRVVYVDGYGFKTFYGYTVRELAAILRRDYGMHFTRLINGGRF